MSRGRVPSLSLSDYYLPVLFLRVVQLGHVMPDIAEPGGAALLVYTGQSGVLLNGHEGDIEDRSPAVIWSVIGRAGVRAHPCGCAWRAARGLLQR